MGLNWDSFKWRNHQSEIGRFFNIDPLTEKYYYNSPYAFSENRVINGRELEGLEWVNSTGQQIYNPKANEGKGGYTEHATKNDKHLGESLQKTNTGKEQFQKLVNSKHPIDVKLNNSSEVTYSKNGKVEFGKTDNKGYTEMEFGSGAPKPVSTVEKSTITINLESIEQVSKNGGSFGPSDVTGLTFDELLGAVFGHEIQHTTNESFNLDTRGKDSEVPAYKVSDKIILETKEKKNDEKK